MIVLIYFYVFMVVIMTPLHLLIRHSIDHILSWSGHTGRRHMTGTRRDCALTRSLTDKQMKNHQSCFHFHQNFSCRLWGPDTGRNPSWVRLLAAPSGRTAARLRTFYLLGELVEVVEVSADRVRHRVPAEVELHLYFLPHRRPESPAAQRATSGIGRAHAPRVSASLLGNGGRSSDFCTRNTIFPDSRWSDSSVRDWSSSGNRKPTSGGNTLEMSFNSNSLCFLHHHESIQTPQLTL